MALEGATMERIVERLKLEPSDPDSYEAVKAERPCFELGDLNNGWLLLMHRMKDDGVVLAPEQQLELSREWRVVACDEESHAGFSASGEWRDGKRVWTLVHEHDADNALQVLGEPPAEVSALLRAQRPAEVEEDEDNDAYEVPLKAARLLVGYGVGHADSADIELRFYVGPQKAQAAAPPPHKPWWRFW
jgi:hypothetical protein